MKKRLKDLNKLSKYTRDLGLKLRYIDQFEDPDQAGEYCSTGTITIAKKNVSLLSQLITLLHELGHHRDFSKRPWSEREDEAEEIFANQGIESPEWVKKTIWDREEWANFYILPITEELDISIPLQSLYYDIEKTRKLLRMELNQGRIKNKEWRKEKKKIWKRMKGKNVSKKKFKRITY